MNTNNERQIIDTRNRYERSQTCNALATMPLKTLIFQGFQLSKR